MESTPGIWVRQILATGAPAYGKYTNVALEKWTFQEMFNVWSEVTGKKGFLVSCSLETFQGLYGPPGYEYGLQLKYGELCDPWKENENFISAEALGIDPKEVVGFRGVMEKCKFWP